MRVPVRRQPETRVSEEQQSFARPVAPLNVEPITRLIEGFRDQLLDEQDARQRIELNQRLMREANELQLDFAARQTNPDEYPEDFAERTNVSYSERHRVLREELNQAGYSQDLLDDFDGRLGTLRQGFFERGLAHQITQLTSRAEETIEDTSLQASQYASVDPINNYETARETVRNSVLTHPDLRADQRAALEDRELAVVRQGASDALAIQNPQLVVDKLDPQGLTAPFATTPTAGAPATQGTSVIETVEAENPSGILYREFRARGWTDAGARQMVAQIGRENRFDPRYLYGEHQDANPRAGTNIGMVSWNGPRRTAFLQFMTERGLVRDGRIVPGPESLRAQVEFVDQEMRERYPQSAAAVRDPNGTYDTIEQTLSNNYFVWDRAGRVVGRETAQRGLRQMRADFDRYGQGGTQAASGEAPAFRPAPAGAGSGGGGRGPAPSFVPTAEEQAAAAPEGETARTAAVAGVRTGIAVLDDLTGPERMRVLTRARERLTQATASQRAEMDVTRGNILAEVGRGIVTPIPTRERLIELYGPVDGAQHHAQLEQAVETDRVMPRLRTLSPEAIERELATIRPTPGTPTYAAEMQVYRAAEAARDQLLEARQRDPAAYAQQYFPSVAAAARSGNTARYYAELDRAYQALGIDTRNAPVLTAEQTQTLTRNYRTMGAAERGRFIEQNMEEMGEQRFRRFVDGMEGTTAAEDARIYALLRSYPGEAQTRNLFQEILNGRETIAQDPARRPREVEVREVFRRVGLTAVRDLNPQTSRAIQEGAEALYAQRGGDPVHINTTLYQEALRDVLGGSLPVNMARGRATSYTILPPRVTEQQFRTWMEMQTIRTLTEFGTARQAPRWGDLRTPVPIQSIIDEGVFTMVAPGYYKIRMASDGRPLKTPDGNDYIMRISPNGLRTIRPGQNRPPLARYMGEGGVR